MMRNARRDSISMAIAGPKRRHVGGRDWADPSLWSRLGAVEKISVPSLGDGIVFVTNATALS